MDYFVDKVLFPVPQPCSYNLVTTSRDAKLVHIPRISFTNNSRSSSPSFGIGYYCSQTFRRLMHAEAAELLHLEESSNGSRAFSSRRSPSAPNQVNSLPDGVASSHLVIYCHPNAIDIGAMVNDGLYLSRKCGVDVLVIEYSGYGFACGNSDIAYESAVSYFRRQGGENEIAQGITQAETLRSSRRSSGRERSELVSNVPKWIEYVKCPNDEPDADFTNLKIATDSGVRASESALFDDLTSAVMFANKCLGCPLHQIILMGRSIGTNPCATVAARIRTAVNTPDPQTGGRGVRETTPLVLAGVMLQAPFASISTCVKTMIDHGVVSVSKERSAVVRHFARTTGGAAKAIAWSLVADNLRTVDVFPHIFDNDGLSPLKRDSSGQLPSASSSGARSRSSSGTSPKLTGNDLAYKDKTQSKIVQLAHLIHPPRLIIQHGDNDAIVPLHNTHMLIEAATAPDTSAGEMARKFLFFSPSRGYGHNDLDLEEAGDLLIMHILKPHRSELQEMCRICPDGHAAKIVNLEEAVQSGLRAYLALEHSYFHEMYCSRFSFREKLQESLCDIVAQRIRYSPFMDSLHAVGRGLVLTENEEPASTNERRSGSYSSVDGKARSSTPGSPSAAAQPPILSVSSWATEIVPYNTVCKHGELVLRLLDSTPLSNRARRELFCDLTAAITHSVVLFTHCVIDRLFDELGQYNEAFAQGGPRAQVLKYPTALLCLRRTLARHGNPLGAYLIPRCNKTINNSSLEGGCHFVVFGGMLSVASHDAKSEGKAIRRDALYKSWLFASLGASVKAEGKDSKVGSAALYCDLPRYPIFEIDMPTALENILIKIIDVFITKQSRAQAAQCTLTQQHVDMIQLECERLSLAILKCREKTNNFIFSLFADIVDFLASKEDSGGRAIPPLFKRCGISGSCWDYLSDGFSNSCSVALPNQSAREISLMEEVKNLRVEFRSLQKEKEGGQLESPSCASEDAEYIAESILLMKMKAEAAGFRYEVSRNTVSLTRAENELNMLLKDLNRAFINSDKSLEKKKHLKAIHSLVSIEYPENFVSNFLRELEPPSTVIQEDSKVKENNSSCVAM